MLRGFFFPVWYFFLYTEQATAHYYWKDHFLGQEVVLRLNVYKINDFKSILTGKTTEIFYYCFFHRMADVTPKVRRRRWGLKDMETATEAVEQGTTVSETSRQFDVPRKTLDDRVKGGVQHGSNQGPNTALTAEEEKALVAYLFHMAERVSSDSQYGRRVCMGSFFSVQFQ